MQCDAGDTAIYYEAYGAGQPIVMLPGRPSDHRVMARFMEPLFTQRDGWLRLYPDLPGTGHSPGVERLATRDQMLDAVLAFIDTVIPGQRFLLAGLSYGGYLARGVIHRRAASMDGLLLCAPQVKAEPAEAQLPPRTPLVEDAALAAQLGPVAGLVVVQSPPVVEAARGLLAEVELVACHGSIEQSRGLRERSPSFPQHWGREGRGERGPAPSVQTMPDALLDLAPPSTSSAIHVR